MARKGLYRAAGQASAPPATEPVREYTPGSVTDKISSTIFSGTPLWWWAAFLVSSALAGVFVLTLLAVATQSVGLWGINVPVVWGMAIVNLIFWIGIGHAGTFISAFLLLMRQHWRSAFSRYAEAMTLFALATAGVFPLFHLGRIEYFYYIVPYPNTFGLNSQWRSALVWDFVAISTYGLVSAIFWFIDLLPDIAAMRDKAENRTAKRLYGLLSMGWRGDAVHWEYLHKVAYTLAALATPLVISVHSVVGLDFAIGILPGWHHTIFPPYFVAGAVYSGLAMVIIVGAMLRSGFGLQDLITMDHIDKAARLMLVMGLLVAYGYASEAFGAWYKGDIFEVETVVNRALPPYGIFFWGMIFFNVVLAQLLWFKPIRRNINALVIISIGILIGMWLERFVIVSISLTYSYLPAVWELFRPTLVDWLTIISPFGFFLAPFLLFARLLPVVPIFETQQIAAEEAEELGHELQPAEGSA